jgi:uncharacterized protein YjbI with pentapeptide repeats
VRIGGIYALERVARDSARDHPTVIEVLTAFIREHSREPWPPPRLGGSEEERLTRPDVQAAATVVGRRDVERDIQRIDLTGAVLISANLSGANLSRADLTGANLTRANLSDTILASAGLRDTVFTHANLRNAVLTGAVLWGTNLTDAFLWDADLTRASIHDVNFTGAKLDGGDCNLNV